MPDLPQAESAASSPDAASSGSAPEPLVPKRPLMRPVSRPVPTEATALPKPTPPVMPPPSPVAAPAPSQAVTPPPEASPAPPEETGAAVTRQQPISPPSEPKQYRAIGLLRGRYVPSEEQFTRGEMIMGDGTTLEAVLLGRIMSLVKNHLDLTQDHLWVVYPRTREMQTNLHAQIVGVWEPERLRKDEEDAEGEPIAEPQPTPEPMSPGHEDDYFSIRGEIVFHAPERGNLVVKIQQAPRKGSEKAKAFKLQLSGQLPSERTVGYFWDLQVKRQLNNLVVTSGKSIGLIPPRKRDKDEIRGDRRPPRRDGRGAPPNRGARPMAGGPPPVRREALPKPAKRTDKPSEG